MAKNLVAQNTIQQNAVILAASKYDFEDASKKQVRGCSITYVLTDDMSPFEDSEKSLKGYRPVKANLPYEAFADIQEAPAVYTLDLEIRAASDGKIALVPVKITFFTSIFS